MALGLLLIISTVAISCLIPSFRNFERTQQDSLLVSNVQLAVRAMNREIQYSTTAGIVIIPQTYVNPLDGKSHPGDAIAFSSVLGRDGAYDWDSDGNPVWQKNGIFYLEGPEGNLWYQENFLAPSAVLQKPANAFIPNHTGPNRDRLIARNIQELTFTDASDIAGTTDPQGTYIKVNITGSKDGRSFTLKTCINTQKAR